MKPASDNSTLTLPPALLAEVEAAADEEHRPVADVLRDLVERGLSERRARAQDDDSRLEAELLEGLASKSIPLDEDFWARLEAKTGAIIDKHNASKAM